MVGQVRTDEAILGQVRPYRTS